MALQKLKLRDVCKIDGARNLRRNIPYVGMEDIESNTGRFLGQLTPRGVKSSTFYFTPEHLLYGRLRPYLNKVLLPSFRGHCSTEIFPLKPNGLIDKRFLFHWITSEPIVERINKTCTGARMPRANMEQVLDFGISVPSLHEQKRIVAVLDESFESISKAKECAEKNLASVNELFKSYLQSELLNEKWEQKLLGEVCEGIEYGTSSKSKKSGQVPVLRMGNIQNGRIDWTKLVYSDDKTEIKKYRLKHNDVLFNRTNSPEWVGKTAIYKSERPAIFAGYLIRIHRKEKLLDADYLNYFLNSDMAMKYGKTVTISSVNQANINGAKLMRYPIPVPPIAEQKNIVKRLNSLATEIQSLESVYTRKLADLEELKKSILQKAFSGELAG